MSDEQVIRTFLCLGFLIWPDKEFAFDLKAMGAIESFIRREGGPVGFAFGKPGNGDGCSI